MGNVLKIIIILMAKKDELMAEEVASEPQKKRTRIAKKDTSDHVYSVSGDKGENLDQAKKKRTRTKKTEAKAEAVETAVELPTEAPAEQVAEAVAEAAAETQPEPVGEVAEPVAETEEKAVPAEPEEKVAEEPVKRKRGRKSKEEAYDPFQTQLSRISQKAG